LNKSFEEKRSETARRLGIDPASIPRHIAIIMDGNGRWAQKQALPRFEGHRQGGKTVETIAVYCVDLGIEYLTLYSFSMQNWKRPKEEIDFLMYLYSEYLEGIRPNLMRDNVKLVHLGERKNLPDKVIETLDETMKLTGENTGMLLGLALNYGAREEIVLALKKIAQEYKAGDIKLENIDPDCIDSHLYTSGFRDPDMLIRTSGEMRISNFLLWQISYAEFYVTETLWPDFSKEDLDQAIKSYATRSRRFGDIKSGSPARNP